MDREALGRRLHELGCIERPGLLKEWDELNPDARESYRRIGEAVAAEVFDAALASVEELERKWRGWAIGLPAPNPLLKPTEAKNGADVLRLAIMAIERARAQTPPRSPARSVPLKPTTTRRIDADAAREALEAEDAGRVPVSTRRPPTPPRSPAGPGGNEVDAPQGGVLATGERGEDLCACGHRRDEHALVVQAGAVGCGHGAHTKNPCRCDYFETEEEDGGA